MSLSIQFSNVKYIHISAKQTSGTFLSCRSEILYPLNNFLFLLLQSWITTILLFVSMNLTILDMTYRWNHTVCVFWGYLSLLTNTGFILADVWYTPCCSVAQSCATLCDPMDRSTPGFPVLHCLPEFAQTHVRGVNDVIQPSHPLLSPSSPSFNLSQNQGLLQWVRSSQQVARVLGFQLQSFQGIFRTDFL